MDQVVPSTIGKQKKKEVRRSLGKALIVFIQLLFLSCQ
jgi:hypothetical protein